MSRSGYGDDGEIPYALWQQSVKNAIDGKRGQRLIRDLRDALEAMPEKVLVANEVVTPEGDVCALGCVARARGVAGLEKIDPEDWDHWYWLAHKLDIARVLVQEIEDLNDEPYPVESETPQERWLRVRAWCDNNLKPQESA